LVEILDQLNLRFANRHYIIGTMYNKTGQYFKKKLNVKIKSLVGMQLPEKYKDHFKFSAHIFQVASCIPTNESLFIFYYRPPVIFFGFCLMWLRIISRYVAKVKSQISYRTGYMNILQLFLACRWWDICLLYWRQSDSYTYLMYVTLPLLYCLVHTLRIELGVEPFLCSTVEECTGMYELKTNNFLFVKPF
jgi:hypothetical protein